MSNRNVLDECYFYRSDKMLVFKFLNSSLEIFVLLFSCVFALYFCRTEKDESAQVQEKSETLFYT